MIKLKIRVYLCRIIYLINKGDKMDSKNKLQEIKSSDEKVVNKKLLKDL